jgi:hypothetical protein
MDDSNQQKVVATSDNLPGVHLHQQHTSSTPVENGGKEEVKNMKLRKFCLMAALAVLALAATSYAAHQLAMSPQHVTVPVDGPPKAITFSAFCNQTPCNLKWTALLSDDRVGNIDTASGPQTHFVVGTVPGRAVVVVSDGQGHMDFAIVEVVGVER